MRKLAGLIGFLLVFGAGLSAAQAQGFSLQPVVTNLPNPVAVVNAGDGSNRLFIVLQIGRILVYDGTGVLGTDFLDIHTRVLCCGERGLLGLVFHPDYPSTPYFYVNYINNSGNTVIARYTISGNANIANPDSEKVIITVTQPSQPGFTNHKAGDLHFGPDGYLYIPTGDGGSGGDPDNRAQNLSDPLGKILRIDVNVPETAVPPYLVPADNPFVGTPGARPEIWGYGLRNPWRISFDRLTGDLFVADVGQGVREEVNFQPAGAAGGRNYGWRIMEGSICFNPMTGCNTSGITLPVVEYDHSLGCSITGGYRYRGTQVPALTALYVYGDFCSGRIWGATQTGPQSFSTTQLMDTALNISTFGEDEAGELYVVHLDDFDGVLYRIVPSGPVDGAPPDTTITGGPSGAVTSGDATFTWTGSDNVTATGNLVYSTRLEPVEAGFGAFGSATSRSFFGLANGPYTFHVRARDQAGNVDPSPATRSFTVDAAGTPGEIVIDNAGAGVQDPAGGRTFTGTWCLSLADNSFGANSLYSCGSPSDTYRFTPGIQSTAAYDVYVWWSSHQNRSTNVPISVVHAGGTTTTNFNEQVPGGLWVLHGRYTLNAGTGGYVQVSAANGQAAADAARFVPVPGAPIPTVVIAATDDTATEAGPTTGQFTVTRTGSTAAGLTVLYTVNGTASPGGDYAALSGSVTIPAGASSAPIVVTPVPDGAATEGDETVVVTLTANAAYSVGSPAVATVTIVNDPGTPAPEVILDNAPVGVQGGGRSFTGSWCVSTSGGSFGPESLYSCTPSSLDTYRFTPGLAAGTYEVSVWWTQHANRSATVPITVAHSGGTTVRTFNQQTSGSQWVLHGTYAFNGSGGHLEISDANGQASADGARFVRVTGGPPLPTVTISASTPTASEAGLVPGAFTVNRTGSTTAPLTVAYTVNGTATPGSDYTTLSGTVTIAVDASSAPIPVTPLNDDLVEPDETVVVTLSANAAYTVGSPAAATVTITSDDATPLPAVTISATTPTASEAGLVPGAFTVSRTGSTTAPLTVAYTVNGTATPGSDYTTLSGTVTIAVDASSAPIPVTPLNDDLVEPDETVVVTLSANAAYTVGSPAAATVTIASEDAAPGDVVIVDNSSPGGAAFGSWCLSGAPNPFGPDSLYSCGSGVDTFQWTPSLTAGSYDVYVWWTAHSNRTTSAPIAVTHAGGTTTRTFNQRLNGGQWVFHGRYTFAGGTSGFVQVTSANGQVAADAVRFAPAGSPAPVVDLTLDNAPAGVQDASGGRTFTGAWCLSGSTGAFGTESLYGCGAGTDVYQWTPGLAAGTYNVYVWWTSHANRSATVPISVMHAGGSTTQTYDQRGNGGQWVLHGTYSFAAGAGSVQVSDVNGQAAADAVRFVTLP